MNAIALNRTTPALWAALASLFGQTEVASRPRAAAADDEGSKAERQFRYEFSLLESGQ